MNLGATQHNVPTSYHSRLVCIELCQWSHSLAHRSPSLFFFSSQQQEAAAAASFGQFQQECFTEIGRPENEASTVVKNVG